MLVNIGCHRLKEKSVRFKKSQFSPVIQAEVAQEFCFKLQKTGQRDGVPSY